jgi:hypothetical protein
MRISVKLRLHYLLDSSLEIFKKTLRILTQMMFLSILIASFAAGYQSIKRETSGQSSAIHTAQE